MRKVNYLWSMPFNNAFFKLGGIPFNTCVRSLRNTALRAAASFLQIRWIHKPKTVRGISKTANLYFNF